MREIQLPAVAIVFSILISMVFFSKKRVELLENKIFSYILIFTIIESVIVFIERILVMDKTLNQISSFIFNFLNISNKIDFFIIISIASCIFLYTILITFPKIIKNINRIYLPIIIINIVSFFGLIFSSFELIEKNNIISVSGTAIVLTYVIAGIYLVLSILITLVNFKKISIRHIPILSIIFISFLLMYIFSINPYVVINSITITFIVYLMYFTLENPDVRMIEQLNIAKSESEKANLAKSDFLASMSHEIRTPLNAITGFSHAILNSENLDEEVEGYAQDIVKSSDTLLEIVGGVLDVSKIESNKMDIIEVLYNPREEIEDLVKMVKVRLGEKPIIFNYKIAEDLPYQLYGDKTNVKKVVTNLLTNAVKYTAKGQILFNVKCINRGDICYVIISVQDTGMGIKEENITKLFTKFERLEVERNTTAEGTGLGLAITKKLIDLMGGKINVKSQYGVGSIFMVQVPQRIAMMSKPLTDTQMLNTLEVKKRKEEQEKCISGQKILIVDDNALNIKVAKIALKNFDLILDEVSSGDECLEKITAGENYDLILMDIMMPGLSGEETFEKLKSIPGFNTPVIALTADAISGSKEKYLGLGFNSYISKPFSPDEIKSELIKIFKK